MAIQALKFPDPGAARGGKQGILRRHIFRLHDLDKTIGVHIAIFVQIMLRQFTKDIAHAEQRVGGNAVVYLVDPLP